MGLVFGGRILSRARNCSRSDAAASEAQLFNFRACDFSSASIDMSFRKRNIGLSSGSSRTPASSSDCGIAAGEIPSPSTSAKASAPIPGVRPSPLDGRPATSTGTPTLDNLLAGHAGLALGTSLLIEESGTTDFAGALLRYYAAEGVVQGHIVHVVGVGEQWGRELPGLVGAVEAEGESDSTGKEKKERMKIAWRYERLGQFGAGVAGTRGGRPLFLFIATGVHRNEWIVTIINQLSQCSM